MTNQTPINPALGGIRIRNWGQDHSLLPNNESLTYGLLFCFVALPAEAVEIKTVIFSFLGAKMSDINMFYQISSLKTLSKNGRDKIIASFFYF